MPQFDIADAFPPLLAQQKAEDVVVLVFALCMLVFELLLIVLVIAVTVANLYYNFKALDKLPPQFRQMEPYQVFFLLIPCFNVIWQFFVFTKVPMSLQYYFHSKGRMDVGDCGQQLGLWTAICAVVCPIPVLVLLPMYVLKIKNLQEQIEPNVYPVPPKPPGFG